MKSLVTILVLAGLVVGCVSPPLDKDFYQSGIRIMPPAHTDFYPMVMADGGTAEGTITDARGRTIPIFIDHRLGTKTPGAIYLMAYPGRWGSVRVRNEAEFRQVVGWK